MELFFLVPLPLVALLAHSGDSTMIPVCALFRDWFIEAAIFGLEDEVELDCLLMKLGYVIDWF